MVWPFWICSAKQRHEEVDRKLPSSTRIDYPHVEAFSGDIRRQRKNHPARAEMLSWHCSSGVTPSRKMDSIPDAALFALCRYLGFKIWPSRSHHWDNQAHILLSKCLPYHFHTPFCLDVRTSDRISEPQGKASAGTQQPVDEGSKPSLSTSATRRDYSPFDLRSTPASWKSPSLYEFLTPPWGSCFW